MNILERTKLLEHVAEADRKSAEAVAKVNSLEEIVQTLAQRIEQLSEPKRLGRPPKATEGNDRIGT